MPLIFSFWHYQIAAGRKARPVWAIVTSRGGILGWAVNKHEFLPFPEGLSAEAFAERILALGPLDHGADSPLAHRASGVRGALLRSLDEQAPDPQQIDRAVDAALAILRQAAEELRTSRQI